MFISSSSCLAFFSLQDASDATLVIGWAGLNHLQRAQAIAACYLARKEQDAWGADQLMPMLVALGAFPRTLFQATQRAEKTARQEKVAVPIDAVAEQVPSASSRQVR